MLIDCFDRVVTRKTERHRPNEGLALARFSRSRKDCLALRSCLRTNSCSRKFSVGLFALDMFPSGVLPDRSSESSGLPSDTLSTSRSVSSPVGEGFRDVMFRTQGRVSGSNKTQGITRTRHPIPSPNGSHKLRVNAVELIAGPKSDTTCAPH
jgi:hypothetical protein